MPSKNGPSNRGRLIRLPDADFAQLVAKAKKEKCSNAEMIRRLMADHSAVVDELKAKGQIDTPSRSRRPTRAELLARQAAALSKAVERTKSFPSFWESRGKK